MNHPLELPHQTGPVLVTLAYVALYYAFQIRVAIVRRTLAHQHQARGATFDRYFGQDRTMLAADRVQLNMLEHMPPFLVLLWLNAVLIGPRGATLAGGIYVLARGAYPLLSGGQMGQDIKERIALATVPGYLVLSYLGAALIWTILGG